MESANSKLNRREFLQKGAAVAAGTAAVATGSSAMNSSALSYSRILGANDRISVGHIGIGDRGRELDGIVAGLKDSTYQFTDRDFLRGCGRRKNYCGTNVVNLC